jgi:2-(1,2-epoxy-1,2-dihydrophenyl)acetyl-CoA isomerase
MQHRTWVALHDALLGTADHQDRVVVLTGAGGNFCAGQDLGERLPTHQIRLMRLISDTVTTLYDLPVPTIAKVSGLAVGIGFNLALCCDLVVADEGARFSEIFARRGLSIDGGGTWLLPRIVGLQRAKEIAFFADVLSAAEARDLGVISRVVPPEDLDATVDDWATKLAAGPPLALGLTKRLMNQSFDVSLGTAVEAEATASCVNVAWPDTIAAFRAFNKGQPASFSDY